MESDLEVFGDITSFRRPSRLLYHFNCTEDLKRRLQDHIGQEDFAEHFGMFRPVHLSPKAPPEAPRPDFSVYYDLDELPAGTTINNDGVAVVPSGFYHFTGFVSPLANATSLQQIEQFPIRRMAGWDVSHYEQIVRQAHAAGRVVTTWAGHMYETAWQIRGYEAFLMDLLERPAWAESLLDRIAANNLFRAQAAAAAGADALHCGDDIASQKALMFSPEIWRRFMLSRWSAVWAAAKKIKPDIRIHYHSDGDILEIVPELVAAGVDILNPVQPECLDATAIYARFAGRLAMDGLIGTQSTMPFGSADDVRRRVRECVETYGRSGGLILSPTHILEPEVPIANIEAFVEACREYTQ